MKKIVSTLMGLTLALAVAGVSFAQTAPAPATKSASKTEKTTKKASHAKKTKKSVSATPSK